MTESAARALRGLLEEKSLTASDGLRLAIERGGCAGLQYSMTIGSRHENDILVEKDGANLFIDPESAGNLEGCAIDYEESLSGAGFRVRNPNAVRSCGCGTSFEPANPGGKSEGT